MGPEVELLNLSLEHYQRRQYDEAKEVLRRLIATEPESEKAWFLMGVIEHEGGREQEAQQCFNKTLNPLLLWLRLGLQFHDQDPERALSCFNRVLREDPENNYALYYKGLILQKMGYHKESCEAFRLMSPLKDFFSRVLIPFGFMALLGVAAIMLFSRGETGLSVVTLLSAAFCVLWLQRDAGTALGMLRKRIQCR